MVAFQEWRLVFLITFQGARHVAEHMPGTLGVWQILNIMVRRTTSVLQGNFWHHGDQEHILAAQMDMQGPVATGARNLTSLVSICYVKHLSPPASASKEKLAQMGGIC